MFAEVKTGRIAYLILESGIILAILGAIGSGFRAYGEFSSLKTRVDALEKIIDKIDTRLETLPLCRSK